MLGPALLLSLPAVLLGLLPIKLLCAPKRRRGGGCGLSLGLLLPSRRSLDLGLLLGRKRAV
eukprot:16123518-Heterocapsa_arctica.AAC.1